MLRTCATLTTVVPSTTPLEPSAVATRFPEVETLGVAIGVWEPRAGYADPVGTARALFHIGSTVGLAHRFRCPVERVEPGAPPAVVLAGGERMAAHRILLCAGPWTARLCATFGVELPLRIEQHAVATLRAPSGQAALGVVLADCVNGFYGKPDTGNVYCVASLDAGTPVTDPDTPTGRVPHTIAEDLYLRACDRLKPLREAGLTGGWTGLYDVSPDWQPVIGSVAPGVFVHAGTSGHGFKLAPRLGQLVAPLVLDEKADPRLHEFRPQRFETNELLSAGFGGVQVLG